MLALLLLHVLRPDYAPASNFISNYAVGRYGCTVLLSAGFGSHAEWRSYQRIAWMLTALILIGFVVQFLTLHEGMPYGLANRFFVAVLFAWVFTTTTRLRTLARE